MVRRFTIETTGQGLHDITRQVEAVLEKGIYLWEHRRRGSARELVLHLTA